MSFRFLCEHESRPRSPLADCALLLSERSGRLFLAVGLGNNLVCLLDHVEPRDPQRRIAAHVDAIRVGSRNEQGRCYPCRVEEGSQV